MNFPKLPTAVYYLAMEGLQSMYERTGYYEAYNLRTVWAIAEATDRIPAFIEFLTFYVNEDEVQK